MQNQLFIIFLFDFDFGSIMNMATTSGRDLFPDNFAREVFPTFNLPHLYSLMEQFISEMVLEEVKKKNKEIIVFKIYIYIYYLLYIYIFICCRMICRMLQTNVVDECSGYNCKITYSYYIILLYYSILYYIRSYIYFTTYLQFI